MGTFGEYIKSAFASIRNNKGRSFLTMLGIIIGIAAVLTVLIIGDGMKATVNGEMESLGVASVSVSLDATKTDKTFSVETINQIEENISDIYGISPNLSAYGTVTATRSSYDVSLTGAKESIKDGNSIKILYGRFYNKADVDDSKNVCVISQSAAKTLFGKEDAVGNFLDVTANNMTSTFSIVGVSEDTSLDIAYASFGEDMIVNMNVPYTSLANAFGINLDKNLTSFNIYVESENKDAVLKQARAIVETVMGIRGENAVKISSGYGFDSTVDSILNIITSVVAIIAAISLLVGGIGVMNIMTVSVTERTREIGIRKSLGARTSSILVQFLAEAAILTFTGGIIGMAFGIGFAFIICKVIDFSFYVNPVLVALVVMISTAIGLFFGIYPAKRAAKLDPIEALRNE